MGAVTALKFARIFGPWIAIAALIAVVLIYRADNKTQKLKTAAAEHAAAELSASNQNNARVMAGLAAQRVDNDAIATAVAARIHINVTRETRIVTALKEAKQHDPSVSAWAATPIPGSVRDALAPAADNVQSPAP